MGAFNQLQWRQNRFFKAGPSALENVWLGQLLTHRLLVGCGLVFRKEGGEASGMMAPRGIIPTLWGQDEGELLCPQLLFCRRKSGVGVRF